MERNKYVLSVLIMMCFSTLFAQNYKIEDFLPDSLTTWQIYGSGDISGTFHKNQSSNISKSFRTTPNANYKFYRTCKKLENYIYIKGNANISGQNNSEGYLYSKNYSLTFENQNRYYLHNRFGLSFPLNGSIILYKNKNKYNYNDTYVYSGAVEVERETGNTKMDGKDYSITASPGIFFGRIYNGIYAAKAMEIVGELQKNNLLLKKLTKEEFEKLSEIIMSKRAIYHYDSRIKKLEAMDAIISYLKSINVVGQDSHQAVLIIEDIYSYSLDFADTESRKFGLQIYSNIIGRYSNSNSTYIDDIDITETRYYLPGPTPIRFNQSITQYNEVKTTDYTYNYFFKGFEGGILYHKIVNWHLFYNILFNFQLSKFDNEGSSDYHTYRLFISPNPDSTSNYSNNYDDDGNRNMNAINLSSNINYQFNSRSILSINSSIKYSKYDEESKFYNYKLKEFQERFIFEIIPSFRYYLTPKFNITFRTAFYSEKWFYKSNYIYPGSANHQYKSSHIKNTANASISFGYYL